MDRNQKSVFSRDLGESFKKRFPKIHKTLAWIVLPLAYVISSSLADNGSLQAIPDAILRLAVIAPAFLQVFWIPGKEIDRLIKLKDRS